jgi:hypothetical protein
MPPTDSHEDTVPPARMPARSEKRLPGGDAVNSGESRRLLRLALPADPIVISVARQQVHRWLVGLSWPSGQLDDIVLAVSEAVSNAIEYAYLDQLVTW